MNLSSFPELETERLILRKPALSDGSAVFGLRSDPEVNRFLDRKPAKSIREAQQFIIKILEGIERNEWVYWAICRKYNPELIGTICLWNFADDGKIAETGYELLPAFSGFGYMDEALKAVIQFGFKTLGMNRMEAWTHRENYRSTRLLLNNSFTLDPDQKETDHPDQVIYCLSRPVY